MRAEPPHTVLMEIDFQHWIIESIDHRSVIDQAAAVRADLRATGARVLCTRYLSLDADDRLRADPTGRGASFHPALAPAPGDLVLSKHSRNVFDNPDVETNLRLLGVADACAGTSAESHDRALAELSRDGITVIRDRYPTPRPNVTRVRSD